uniref:Putative Calcium-dependent lipid-binding family protein n=1 Tax=Davidia involucrata TaxID=16924 RepID=A0A5B6ZXN4_DAVIN
MESKSLEIKVMYCKDLKSFNFFQKLSVYAVVSIVSDDPNKILQEQQQQHRTPTDTDGDGNPEWNHEMRFDLGDSSSIFCQDCDHLFLHFDLRSEGLLVFGDKSIGEVRVPFKDLVQEINGIVRFVSYEVRTSDGKSNGVLNFSYKVKDKGMEESTGSSFPESQIDGYPIVHHHHHHHHHHHTNSSAEMHQTKPEVVPSPFSLPSSQIHYPSLDLQSFSDSQEGYYSPEKFHYLPPPPPSLLPPVLYPPPPPPFPPPLLPVAGGEVYQNPPAPWVYPDAWGMRRNHEVEQQFGALVDNRESARPNYYYGAGIGRDQDWRSWDGK